MRKEKNVQLITDNDFCISCGACKHACPYQEIQIVLNARKQIYEPEIQNPVSCETCPDHACLLVCPGYEENFVELADWKDPQQPVGPYHALYTGHSISNETRARASSGGMIKEICRYYLEHHLADGIITLRHKDGLDYEPDVYSSVEDILQSPASIYHSINFEQAIELLKTRVGKFVLIANPCQLTSIRKWQNLSSSSMRAEIVAIVGLICGWMYTRHSVQHFCHAVGIDYNSLTNATYRGGDNMGLLRLSTTSRTYEFSRQPVYKHHSYTAQYKAAFSRMYNIKRCLLCVEHINYLADVVVGDAWLKRFANDTLGTSLVLARSQVLNDHLLNMVAEGRIHLDEATLEDVLVSQHNEEKVVGALRMINKLQSQGHFVPCYTMPRSNTQMPGTSLWFKNYIKPLIFRLLTFNGMGLMWYRIRVFLAHIRLQVQKQVYRSYR